MTHEDCRKAAHIYRDLNLSVIPFRLTPDPKNPEKIMKRPVLTEWKQFQTRLPSHEEIDSWWQQFPNSCVAIITGKISGITVLDVDNGAACPHFTTLTQNTINGGRHHIFKHAAIGNKADIFHARSSSNPLAAGVDIRCDGGLIVASPSHCGEKRYKFDPLTPFTKENLANLAQFPEEIKKRLAVERITASSLTKDWSEVTGISTTGTRHKNLLSVIGCVVSRLPMELLESVGRPGVQAWNEKYCSPPKSWDEVDKMFQYCVEKREKKEQEQKSSGWQQAQKYQDMKFQEINDEPF